MGLVTRVYGKLREVGVRYALRIAIARWVPVGWFRAGSLVILGLDPRASGARPDDPGAPGSALRWGTLEDVALLSRFGHARSTLEDRLARGDRVFAMLRDGELLGYAWFRGRLHEEESLGIRFRMAPGEAWLYDAMIARAHRGQGLYTNLLRGAARSLASSGVSRIWIAVESSNRNSVEAHVRAGAVPVRTLRLVRLLGVSWIAGARVPGPPRFQLRGWPEIPSSALAPYSAASAG